MGLGTPLHNIHSGCGAKIVDFGGWDMPLHYGSQIAEHLAVRRDAGMFDVSHMAVIDLTGERVRPFLQYLLANDVGRLRVPGKALYSCMLRPTGGVIDDLIAYFLTESWFRLVVNAGSRAKDLLWIREQAAPFAVEVRERTDLAMIAVQGPAARAKTVSLLDDARRAAALDIAPFAGLQIDSWFIARTGYTGEDGFEIMLPAAEAAATWTALAAAGVAPAGLGARDTLRLEAGMNLYGNDMDEDHDPLESGLAWTVAFDPTDRLFIGREALERERTGGRQLVGLLLEERGVLRGHQRVVTVRARSSAHAESTGDVRTEIGSDAHGEVKGDVGGALGSDTSRGITGDANGEITSGTFSPTLNRAIALARVPRGIEPRVQVDVRGKLLAARVVKLPFVRHGKILVQL
jgi:aminomethyltransferase